MIGAGNLRYNISIEEPITIRNDYGSQEIVWKQIISTRADVIFNNGMRDSDGTEVYYKYTITFKVRHYHNITDYMRIKWNDKYYRILSINKELGLITIITELIND